MRMSLLAVVGSSLASVALVVACSSTTCEDKGTCAGPGAGDAGGGADADVVGDGGGGDVVQPPAGCDASAEPKDAPKCVVSDFGVFVDAASGADTNAGTKEAPVKSIGAALGKLAGKSRIYVCEGTYPEHVKLTSAVSIYGGFACGAWSYSGIKPKVAPNDAGYALEIAGVNDATRIEDVSFSAPAGTAAATSSVAAFVHASGNVTFRRVDLVAGKGFRGATPAKAADGALMTSTPTAGTLNGNAGGTTNGGLAQLCTCVGGGTSKGGGGGSLNGDGNNGETAQAVPSPMTATGAAQSFADCNAGTNSARPGSDAPSAAAGASATKLGTLTDTGWLPAAGAIGTAGTAGQGGGGGGGAGGGGGGGACGGCGGSAGQPGAGGGASIALLSLVSPVTLTQCTLTATDAGAGASGGAGGDGIPGGTKGALGGAACPGGNGGKGGNGGAGGGGAGGISIGVLHKGPKPTTDAVIKTGLKGAPGPGAVDGQSADSLEIQ